MSTKVGIIAEGPIDHALLPALLSRIVMMKVGIKWPIRGEDIAELFQIRKRGHGAVVEVVRRLVEALDTEFFDHHCFVILLDRLTRSVQEEVRTLISTRNRFILGVAIEEIEAWWLGDRTNTLNWADLRINLPLGCRFAAKKYKAEADDNPKLTLDELTRFSERLDSFYGVGNVDLAREFAEDYWKNFASLGEISAQCPEGYKPFERAVINAFRPLKKASKHRK